MPAWAWPAAGHVIGPSHGLIPIARRRARCAPQLQARRRAKGPSAGRAWPAMKHGGRGGSRGPPRRGPVRNPPPARDAGACPGSGRAARPAPAGGRIARDGVARVAQATWAAARACLDTGCHRPRGQSWSKWAGRARPHDCCVQGPACRNRDRDSRDSARCHHNRTCPSRCWCGSRGSCSRASRCATWCTPSPITPSSGACSRSREKKGSHLLQHAYAYVREEYGLD